MGFSTKNEISTYNILIFLISFLEYYLYICIFQVWRVSLIFFQKNVYTYDIMICLLSFLNIYIYIKFEEFSRVLSYKKQCICIGYVHNFDDFLKFIHSVFYLLIPTCKAKSVFYLLTISFLIFYLLDPYYIYILYIWYSMCVQICVIPYLHYMYIC